MVVALGINLTEEGESAARLPTRSPSGALATYKNWMPFKSWGRQDGKRR